MNNHLAPPSALVSRAPDATSTPWARPPRAGHPGSPPARALMLGLGLLSLTCLHAEDRPLREPHAHDDFVIREAEVPMRDGVRLHTLILSPKHSFGPLPMLLERTPYNATRALRGHASTRLEATLGNDFLGHDYIYVVQDIRGRFQSEGDAVLYRPPRGPFNETATDETTDAWDTIDWLVREIPSNGRVGIWGTSYPGWLALAAMREPHPALAAAVPCNPVVDVWKADDWFHWGAFRATYAFDYIYDMETRQDEFTPYPREIQDVYTWALGLGAADTGMGVRLDDRHPMWQRLMASPAYGPYWQSVAADQWFDAPARLVPALHVHGFWDQEDIYGAPAAYAALEKHDARNDRNFFAAGPWYHGQHFSDGSHLGAIGFDEDTAKRFREDVLRPFLRRFLHADTTGLPAPVTVFQTGLNRWRECDQWPPDGETVRLYLGAEGKVGSSPPTGEVFATEYVSDPAKPVPYAPRPNWAIDYGNPTALAAWRRWLVEDQRFVDGRPDVATWTSEPLTEALTVRGPIVAHLFAETTGTDADWVVKFIDVFPDDSPDFAMSGYELMVSGDIFRGRYRESYTEPAAIKPDCPLEYRVPLPPVNHTFQPGHRLMVQVQSTWFPLYDRNPQTFVPNIMRAPPAAYRSQRHRVHHSAGHPTHLELMVDRGASVSVKSED
ncbi:MAG: CocE/NonD family hydrolase [Verrucomicrobiales bacterium]|nr:CocE/NonD family hydrolase [Verrucomicrobiales bacterium]